MNELYYYKNIIYSNKSYQEYTNIFNREVRDCFYNNDIRFKKKLVLDNFNKKYNQYINECYILNININLGHFLHDQFFWFYMKWRLNKKPVLICNKHKQELAIEFIKSIIPNNFIITEDQIIKIDRIIFYPEGRDLKKEPMYLNILKEISDTICHNLNIDNKQERLLNTIHIRRNMLRKSLKNINEEFIRNNNFIEINLDMNFKTCVEICIKTKNYVCVQGAGPHLFGIFLTNANVLEISPHQKNSWLQMFGISKLFKSHLFFISNNIEKSKEATQCNPLLDAHILWDTNIEKSINKLIN